MNPSTDGRSLLYWKPKQTRYMKHTPGCSGLIAAGLSRFLGGIALVLAGPLSISEAVHFASGFRVGEVSQNSAIVWARLTQEPERNWDGLVPREFLFMHEKIRL